MYTTYYGFRERPFSLLPDPAFLYLGKKHQSALSMLLYSLSNQAGFCVLSGEIGAGKTTLIRELLNEVDDDVTIGLVNNYNASVADLLTNILNAFDVDDENATDDAARQRVFSDFLIEQYASNKRTLLIFDEAQHLSVEILESLRMLSNINSDKDMLLQIMLVGQNELRERLRNPGLTQFAQRIVIDFHLEALDQQETTDYIRHRINVVGGYPDMFSRQACNTIYAATNGIPRLINLLCDTALVYGFGEGKSHLISQEIINQVIEDRQGGSLLPLFSVDSNDIKTDDDADEFDAETLKWDAETFSIEEEFADDPNNDSSVADEESFSQYAQEAPDTVEIKNTESEPKAEASPRQNAQPEVDTPDLEETPAIESLEETSQFDNEVIRHVDEPRPASTEKVTLTGNSGFTPFKKEFMEDSWAENEVADHSDDTIEFTTVENDMNSAQEDISEMDTELYVDIPAKRPSYIPGMVLAFLVGVVTYTLVNYGVTGEWIWNTMVASADIDSLNNQR
ncbi:MAG: AAA family ATPase [Gammaproteobacteria bacterium]